VRHIRINIYFEPRAPCIQPASVTQEFRGCNELVSMKDSPLTVPLCVAGSIFHDFDADTVDDSHAVQRMDLLEQCTEHAKFERLEVAMFTPSRS
jgi:hypothetical protein